MYDTNDIIRALTDDIYLPSDITITGRFDTAVMMNPASIFITGVTGFIGIYLLADLLQQTNARMYCLIRSRNEKTAIEKLEGLFREHHISLPEIMKSRIVPVLGDLSKPLLGLDAERFDQLCKTIDVIYHSGSAVNFLTPYADIRKPNVNGLREIIRLAACHKLKCLSLLSTISVSSWGHIYDDRKVLLEDDDIYRHLQAVADDNAYVQSKWVMEQIAALAASKGLPVILYRIGNSMCHSKTGVSALGNWWSMLVKGCIQAGSFPDMPTLREDLTTVDYITAAITHISRQPAAPGMKFNILHIQANNITLTAFFALLNSHFDMGLRQVSLEEWVSQIRQDSNNILYLMLPLITEKASNGMTSIELHENGYLHDCSNLTAFLKDSYIKEPVFTRELLSAYLAGMDVMVDA
ncbi:MAG TPA: thioester reductase domain-containing protein [Chitinophaga sp.]|uniref:thioester reductase domain-containing protein n=1 Tax=Chitinophaga sp. TaxID=1869181 RepID=UPI002CBA3A34|nr:thioester reductase domain-containing protein [Chitinophaga sp.]HVI46068.1 thioester reductase domain-containing protein [Chitinophaga sp.]